MKKTILLGLAGLVRGDCTTIDGTTIPDAQDYVCVQLDNILRRELRNTCRQWDRTESPKPSCCKKCEADWRTCYDECEGLKRIPDELASFSCDPLQPIEHGSVYCTTGNLAGTICIAECQASFELNRNMKKKCKPRRNYRRKSNNSLDRTAVKWSQENFNWSCQKDYVPSPCATSNGGCSHECLDRGDGNHECVCPCGQKLLLDNRTCSIDSEICPFEIDFLVDQSSNVCDSEKFKKNQFHDVGTIVRFFNRELTVNSGKLELGFWGDNSVSKVVTTMNDTMNMHHIVNGFVDEYEELECTEPKLGNVLNSRKSKANVSSVTFVTVAGEVTDHQEALLRNRPKTDNVVVLVNPEIASGIYEEQTQILGCGSIGACPSVLSIAEARAVDIENVVSRSACYDRTFSSSISCNEFNMELRVPKCALKGLRLDDIMFNDEHNCEMVALEEDNHFKWVIDYTACGTAMSSNGTNVVTYENVLRTRLDYTGSVEPVMPLFHVPLKCTVDSTYDFVFHGGWHPDVTSFSAETGALQDQEGQMNLYHDKHFQQQFNGIESVKNGERIYVQSSIEMTEQYKGLRTRLVSCVTKPSEAFEDDAAYTWTLIENGCIIDDTVQMMPHGAKDQMRFSFESFAFVMAPKNEIQIQCKFKVCDLGEPCPQTLPACM